MKMKSLILSIALLLFFSAQVVMANVFAHNVRITQPDSDAPFDGSFDDGSGAAIRFVLSDVADSLTLKVLNDSGTVIRTLSAVDFSSGDSSVVWDGLDDGGIPVATGAYKVSIATMQAGYVDYEVLFDKEIGIWTRGVSSMKSQAVRNFGFQYALSNGGYVTGVARHANDGNEWGDVKGTAQLTVESVDPIGPDNFRYAATADAEGNIFAARRSGTVPAVYMMNADEQVMRRIDSSDWGGQRPQGLAVSGGASAGYLAISNHVGDIYGMDLDGSADYFDAQSDLLVNSNPGAVTTDLYFSEYIEGSSSNKALEIYNGTDAAISLDDYLIAQSSNGSGWLYYHEFPVGATIASGDVWVLIDSGFDQALYDSADADEVLSWPSVMGFNGNDARALIMASDSSIVDVIGVPDSVYAADSTLHVPNFDVAGIEGAAQNHTLIRKSTVYNGNSDWAASAGTNADDSEWIVEEQNTVELGSHTMNVWDPMDNAVFWDVTLGRDQLLYATYNNDDLLFKGGVACFDLSTYTAGTPLLISDAVWKVEIDSSLAHTLTYFFADDPANDIVYFTLNDPPKWDGIGIYAIDVANPTMATQVYVDPDQNMSSFRSDIAMDAVGNIVFFENSNEFVRLISPPGGNTYEYVDDFDMINVLGAESIADIKIDADSNYVPDRMGEVVTTVGIVTSHSFSAGQSIPVTIQDETAGIYLYGASDTVAYNLGDRVQVTGTIDQYNGLTELVVADVADIVLLGQAALPEPIVIAIGDDINPEDLESMLVKMNGLAKVAGDWPAEGINANLDVWSGAKESNGDPLVIPMRIDKDLDIAGQPEPIYPMNVIGVVTQYDSNVPPNDGYQLMPRQYSDIEQDVAATPNPMFWFTSETHTTYDGQSVAVGDVDEEFTFAWHPAVDLNDDDLIYQMQVLIDGASLDINIGADTSLVLTGQDIVDYVYNAESKTVLVTLRTKGAESSLVSSVDTISVTFDITVGVDDMNLIPKKFFVDQNYPNPFNPTTSIKFGLPAEAQVNLVVYDILGRKVATLISNENMSAGTYQHNFDASHLASGTYIYRLQAGQKVEVKKMLLLK